MLKKLSVSHKLLLGLVLLSLALRVPNWLGDPSPDGRGPLDWTGLVVRGLGFVVALSLALRGYARAHRGDYGDPMPDEASDAPRIRLLMTSSSMLVLATVFLTMTLSLLAMTAGGDPYKTEPLDYVLYASMGLTFVTLIILFCWWAARGWLQRGY